MRSQGWRSTGISISGLTAWALAAGVVSVRAQELSTSPPAPTLGLSQLVEPAVETPDATNPAFQLASHAGPPGGCHCPCPSCPSHATKGGEPAGCTSCCHGRLLDWSKIPETIQPMPRTGNFVVPPAPGPAYYSLWDAWTQDCRDKPPKSGYPAHALMPYSFFDADFRYVDALDPAERTLVEDLKRLHLNDCLLLSTGGQFWVRYAHEHNSQLTEQDNDYTLARVRLFGDVSYSDWLRVFGEFLWADSFGEDRGPAAIDVNRGDLLNLFVDLRLFDYEDHPVYVRGGRQELVYGSQRLVSPLDWANTRRTFQGVKAFRQGEKWDYSAFWVQPVLPNPSDFDSPDENQNFVGSWLTYRPQKGTFLDLYYLYLHNSNQLVQQGIERAPLEVNTLGVRYTGDKEGFLWDTELALQLGDQGSQDLVAGMATAGVGRHWKDTCLSPTVWAYYDYASGDANPNDGDYTTFSQLFPFGHYYLGWADLVGRQNIHDANAHLYLYPAPWITINLQYHHFWLNQRRDALYNAAGAAYRRDPTGTSGNNVGDEIDIVTNFHLTRYADILVAYSKLYGGGFLEATAGPNQAADAETLYFIFQQRW